MPIDYYSPVSLQTRFGILTNENSPVFFLDKNPPSRCFSNIKSLFVKTTTNIVGTNCAKRVVQNNRDKVANAPKSNRHPCRLLIKKAYP